jgi:hypothetical protein
MTGFRQTLKNFHEAKEARKRAQDASYDAEQAVKAGALVGLTLPELIEAGDAADEALLLASEQEIYWLRELRKFTSAQRAAEKVSTT